jgi:hypothetical protein
MLIRLPKGKRLIFNLWFKPEDKNIFFNETANVDDVIADLQLF